MFIQRHLPVPMTRFKLGKKLHDLWDSCHCIAGWLYRVGWSFHNLLSAVRSIVARGSAESFFCTTTIGGHRSYISPTGTRSMAPFFIIESSCLCTESRQLGKYGTSLKTLAWDDSAVQFNMHRRTCHGFQVLILEDI